LRKEKYLIKAEWQTFYARFNRLIALCFDSKKEARKFVRHLDAEMDALFTSLLERGVDPINKLRRTGATIYRVWRKRSQGSTSEKGNRWVERIVSLRQTYRLQGKSSFQVLVAAMNCSFKEQQSDLE
jgi:transposase